MNIPQSKTLRSTLPPLLLVGSLLVVYLNTLAPGLTWANDGRDGGDLIAAAATGGVPHPTGYPLYLLLARGFQLLPMGSLAFRTNLFSACTTVLAAVLVYVLVVNWSEASNGTHRWAAGLAAGYAFGLAPLIWSQAVITEVYGLQALLIASILALYARSEPISTSAQKRLDSWRGLVLGLAMGNHLTTVLLVPAALALGSIHVQTESNGAFPPKPSSAASLRLERGALLRQLGMFAVGLSLYLLIPLRAMANPPLNWGNAVTPERFWWLVSGQLYQSYYLQFNLAETWGRLQAAAALLLGQFGLFGVILGLVGLILFGKRSRLFLLTAWTAIICTGFTAIYSSDDSYVYLMPVLLSFAIWMGYGIVGLIHRFGRGSSLMKMAFSLLLIAYLAARSTTYVSQLDASLDRRAESFGREVLSAVPEHAILFAQGDESVFALWYFHFALGERPDLAVLAEDLLHFDWYQENLRATYPSLVVPGPFPWPEVLASANPSRAVCYIRYSVPAGINCLPPLDAP